ncbi:hypothetical protein GGS20DRAFT_589296 [Poronia punctata]|nr:hypothetical protein GGS20DRAFT_589296 [Poronia punctata]
MDKHTGTDVPSVGSNNSTVGEPLLVCSKCGVEFENPDALHRHQTFKGHFACEQCGQTFSVDTDLTSHRTRRHPEDQDLTCPGCHSHFTRLSTFWSHIENHDCKRIFPSHVAMNREKNLQFEKQLKSRSNAMDELFEAAALPAGDEYTWGDEPDNKPQPAPVVPPKEASKIPRHPGTTKPDVHQSLYRPEDFPPITTSDPSNSGHGQNRPAKAMALDEPRGEQKKSAWNQGKKWSSTMAPGHRPSYRSVPPPNSYDNSRVTTSSVNKESRPNRTIVASAAPTNARGDDQQDGMSGQRIIEPGQTGFNAAVFYNDILEKFVCPYVNCLKKFNTANTITKHLDSQAHSGGKLPCFSCGKRYQSVTAVLAHMESTVSCGVRWNDNFPRALSNLTGGLVDIDRRTRLRNGEFKFVIDLKAYQDICHPTSVPTQPLKKGGQDGVASLVDNLRGCSVRTNAGW